MTAAARKVLIEYVVRFRAGTRKPPIPSIRTALSIAVKSRPVQTWGQAAISAGTE